MHDKRKLKQYMKRVLLYVMSALYILAGINHFIFTKQYVSIMPTWLPWHSTLVYISGVLESLYGLLLLPRSTRRLAAMLIIALLIAIFPANVQMTVNYYHENNSHLWLSIVRLPLQLVLIYWAYIYTILDEPG
jgi:uncharacterized membrane protein